MLLLDLDHVLEFVFEFGHLHIDLFEILAVYLLKSHVSPNCKLNDDFKEPLFASHPHLFMLGEECSLKALKEFLLLLLLLLIWGVLKLGVLQVSDDVISNFVNELSVCIARRVHALAVIFVSVVKIASLEPSDFTIERGLTECLESSSLVSIVFYCCNVNIIDIIDAPL